MNRMLKRFHSAALLVVWCIQLNDWSLASEIGPKQQVETTFTRYEQFQASEYDKLLPSPEGHTRYCTRMKCKATFSGYPNEPRREEIVLITLDDTDEQVGIRKAYILAEYWVDSTPTRPKPVQVFDMETRKTDYPISGGLVHGSSGFNPDQASFVLARLSGDVLPDIIITLHFAGGSYASLFVAVVSQRDGELKLALRARCGVHDFGVEYKDLNGDGRDELLLPDEITVAGVDHASCPNWISCYTWNGRSLSLENKLFYRTDLRIEVNILDRYNWTLLQDLEGPGRRYYEEYEYYLGLIHLYKGDSWRAKYFLERVSQRASDRDYSEAARSLLEHVKGAGDFEH